MMLFNYKSKKEMQENIGNHLDYTETSIFGEEYKSNGTFCGSNRPHITGVNQSQRCLCTRRQIHNVANA